MIPGAIFSFLVGAVLAFSFRVWILVPVTLLATVIAMTIELALGASFPTAGRANGSQRLSGDAL